MRIEKINHKNGVSILKVVDKSFASHLSGDVSELRAAAFLLTKDYQVFRNVSRTGPIDLVGIKDSNIELFDVKTISLRKKANGDIMAQPAKLKKEQIQNGIKIIYVTHSGECGFYINEILDQVGDLINLPRH